MHSRSYVLGTVKNVQKFVNIAVSFIEDIDLVKGRYVIDAKSIMGIFSLDVSDPVEVVIHTEDTARAEKLFKEVEDMLRG